MSNNNASGGGIGIGMILFLIFMILKLCNVIAWSWWWVTAPLWIPIGIVVGIMLVAGIIGFVLHVIDR